MEVTLQKLPTLLSEHLLNSQLYLFAEDDTNFVVDAVVFIYETMKIISLLIPCLVRLTCIVDVYTHMHNNYELLSRKSPTFYLSRS